MEQIIIGVIGGSGLYNLTELEVISEEYPKTPWGYPSDKIRLCVHKDSGVKIAFLARHGRGHPIGPSQIPNRANISALKHLGVDFILAFSAVGSLSEEIRPRDFVLPSQVIDRTKGIREQTFFDGSIVAHVGFADPFCEELENLIYSTITDINGVGLARGLTVHRHKTLVVIEGPAFSTRAESLLYRTWGCHVINMSTLPEAKLAREAEIPYQVICMATDYDCWHDGYEDVSLESVLSHLNTNSENAQKLLLNLFTGLKTGLNYIGKGATFKGANKCAIITNNELWNSEDQLKLCYLFPEYFQS